MNQAFSVVLVGESAEAQVQLRKEVMAAGMAVVGEAMTPAEAVELVKASQPDLVLVAVEEPLARHLRIVENLALAIGETPLVAISSLRDREVLRKVVLAGARDLLNLPLQPAELLDSATVLVRQAQKRQFGDQQAAAGALTQGTMITVYGPKGGVGKTTVSSNLAVCLSRGGQTRTALVDLDVQIGSASLMLDLSPQKSLADLMDPAALLEPALVKACMTPHASGLDLLAAPAWYASEDDLDPARVADVLQCLSRQYDYVVVDTPPILNPAVYRTMQMSTYVILVTSLEITSIQACRRVLDRISDWEFVKDKVKLVVNAANSANSIGPKDIESVLGPVFWTVPHDVTAAVASQNGKPVVLFDPGAKVSRALTSLHYTLLGVEDESSKRLLGRLTPWKH